jgi:hypothetical protein
VDPEPSGAGVRDSAIGAGLRLLIRHSAVFEVAFWVFTAVFVLGLLFMAFDG